MTPLDQLRQIAAPVARHEAGHYVAARVLGFRTGLVYVDASIFGAGGGSGLSPHQPLTTMDAVSNYLERRIQVLCAGVCAEYLRDGVVDEDQALNAMRNGGAVNDWSKVTENIRTLFGIRFPDVAAPTEQQLEDFALTSLNQAEELVHREAAAIMAVAQHLVAKILQPGRTELTPAELDQIPEIQKRFGAAR